MRRRKKALIVMVIGVNELTYGCRGIHLQYDLDEPQLGSKEKAAFDRAFYKREQRRRRIKAPFFFSAFFEQARKTGKTEINR